MTKSNFVLALIEVLGQRREAEKVFNKIIFEMRQAIKRGEKVILGGFGSFYPKIRKAQKKQHPITKKMILVPPKRTVKFIPSETLFH